MTILAANAYSIGCYYNDTFVEYGKMHRVRNLVIVIVVNQNDLVGCYISVSVRSRKHWPIISYICYLSTQANMPMVMLMCFLLLIAALRARSMYFEDDVISSESGSQDPNGATEELASQSSSCDQPIGSGSTPRCNLFEDDFAGSSEASDQESTRTRDDSHNESEGGHSSNQGQDDEGGHSDQDEGQDHEGGPSAEAAQDATPRPLGLGKYSREGTAAPDHCL